MRALCFYSGGGPPSENLLGGGVNRNMGVNSHFS